MISPIGQTINISAWKQKSSNLIKESSNNQKQEQWSPNILSKALINRNDKKKAKLDLNKDFSQQQNDYPLINSNSIVKRYQFLLIILMILCSVFSVVLSREGTFFHIKKLTNYFNVQLLGNNNLSLYDQGDNIDQPKLQLSSFTQMNQHFANFLQIINDKEQSNGFTQFYTENNQPVYLQFSTKQEYFFKDQMTMEELQQFLLNQDLKEFILNLKQMQIKINLGQNKKTSNVNLILNYKTYSSLMLNIDLIVEYEPNLNDQSNQNDQTIRILEQLLAFILMSSYLHNAYKIRMQNLRLKGLKINDSSIITLQKNRSYWCYSLAVLNVVIILSQTYAPLASFLQLLPVLQQNDSSNANKYNFNTNLRYAIPVVLRIFLPVATLLNGFIFYSMLMYPGKYFDNYSLGFLSYFYQNFQVGTYQIFMEIQGEGDLAYILYGVLYFYMVLVANNLLPALFSSIIYIKIHQRQLKKHIRKTVQAAICPKCEHQNFGDKTQYQHYQINIASPTINPYVRGKLSSMSSQSHQLRGLKLTKMFVEDEKTVQSVDNKAYMNAKCKKIKDLISNLNKIVLKNDVPLYQKRHLNQLIIKAIQDRQIKILLNPAPYVKG